MSNLVIFTTEALFTTGVITTILAGTGCTVIGIHRYDKGYYKGFDDAKKIYKGTVNDYDRGYDAAKNIYSRDWMTGCRQDCNSYNRGYTNGYNSGYDTAKTAFKTK